MGDMWALVCLLTLMWRRSAQGAQSGSIVSSTSILEAHTTDIRSGGDNTAVILLLISRETTDNYRDD